MSVLLPGLGVVVQYSIDSSRSGGWGDVGLVFLWDQVGLGKMTPTPVAGVVVRGRVPGPACVSGSGTDLYRADQVDDRLAFQMYNYILSYI